MTGVAYKLQIASLALTYDLNLVTHNVHEFSRVEGLKIEDWEAGDDLDKVMNELLQGDQKLLELL